MDEERLIPAAGGNDRIRTLVGILLGAVLGLLVYSVL